MRCDEAVSRMCVYASKMSVDTGFCVRVVLSTLLLLATISEEKKKSGS